MLPFHKRPSSQRCSCAAIPAWPAACPPPASWWVSGEPGCEALGCKPSGSAQRAYRGLVQPRPQLPNPTQLQGLHGPHPCQTQAQEGETRVSGEQRQAFLVPGATTSHSPEDACPLPGYSWDTLAGGGLPSHIKCSPINAGGQAPVYQLTGLRSPRILLPRSLH